MSRGMPAGVIDEPSERLFRSILVQALDRIWQAIEPSGDLNSDAGGASDSDDLTIGELDARYLQKANNLSDVADVVTSRNNLGLGSASDVTFNGLTVASDATISNDLQVNNDAAIDGTLNVDLIQGGNVITAIKLEYFDGSDNGGYIEAFETFFKAGVDSYEALEITSSVAQLLDPTGTYFISINSFGNVSIDGNSTSVDSKSGGTFIMSDAEVDIRTTDVIDIAIGSVPANGINIGVDSGPYTRYTYGVTPTHTLGVGNTVTDSLLTFIKNGLTTLHAEDGFELTTGAGVDVSIDASSDIIIDAGVDLDIDSGNDITMTAVDNITIETTGGGNNISLLANQANADITLQCDDTITLDADEVSVGSTGGQLGFLGSSPALQQSVTGSRGGNVALASLLSALNFIGLIDDNTTA